MRAVITERDVPASGELRVAEGTLVTPSARDAARERGVRIVEVPRDQFRSPADPATTVAVGCDHAGYATKIALRRVFDDFGITVVDLGTHCEKPVDYPDYARAVAEKVARGEAARGVMIDGVGIGSAMVANKVPGVRAALCYDKASARNSREHNDSNVLTIGGRLLTAAQAEEVLRTWLATGFAGGRHAARVEKIRAIEKEFATWKPGN